jgi:hypothetical protein
MQAVNQRDISQAFIKLFVAAVDPDALPENED